MSNYTTTAALKTFRTKASDTEFTEIAITGPNPVLMKQHEADMNPARFSSRQLYGFIALGLTLLTGVGITLVFVFVDDSSTLSPSPFPPPMPPPLPPAL